MSKIYASIILVLILFALLVGLPFAIGYSTKSVDAKKPVDANPILTPHRTSVYFIVDRPNGFVAYVPGGSVYVGVKIQPNVTEPYIEVPKQINNNRFAGPKGEYVAWGFGGTLYVKDLGQLKNLILTKTERE